MNAEILTIGNELLNGSTTNTNSVWLSDNLWRIGISTRRIISIKDEKREIQKALSDSLTRSDIILVTGGLGPTHDDITKMSIAEFFGVSLKENITVKENILHLFSNRGATMPDINLEQALVPEGAEIIQNEIGTAPGFYFEKNQKICFFMPGVPAEMKRMMQNSILPLIKSKFAEKIGHILYKSIRTTGIFESKLFEMLSPFDQDLLKINLSFLPHRYGVDLRLNVNAKNKKQADLYMRKAEESIVSKVSSFIYEIGERSLEQISSDLLSRVKYSIAIAESCTGGLVNNFFTNIPGSSGFLLGGVIAYNNRLKVNVLGVQQETLKKHGAVSPEVALEMAEGVQKLTGSDCALSTTGIAGPTGGTDKKPVGLIYIGCIIKKNSYVQKYIFHKERISNKYRFAYAALNLLRQKLIELIPQSKLE